MEILASTDIRYMLYQIVPIMIADPISLKSTYVFFHRIMNYLYSTIYIRQEYKQIFTS